MWVSKKFLGISDLNFDKKAEEMLKNVFDFDAPTDADPEVMTASDVLDVLGVERTKGNAISVSKVLRRLVGKNQHCRHNGRMGRFYALPPRKLDFL